MPLNDPHVAQRAVAGLRRRNGVCKGDYPLFARGEPLRSLDAQQAAPLLGHQLERHTLRRSVDDADGRLHAPPLIDIGEGAEPRVEADAAAGIERIALFDAPFARQHGAPDAEHGNLPALGRVDAQLLREGAGTVRRVEAYADGDLGAGENRLAREFGHRTAARGHHVEDDERLSAGVLPREGVAHRSVGLADGAEVPLGGRKCKLRLSRGQRRA